MAIQVRFLPDNVAVNAEVGESLLQVADRAGITIPTGCLMGSCHACEVELDSGEAICACITAIPDGIEELTIHLYVDPSW
jgi:ferredoxin